MIATPSQCVFLSLVLIPFISVNILYYYFQSSFCILNIVLQKNFKNDYKGYVQKNRFKSSYFSLKGKGGGWQILREIKWKRFKKRSQLNFGTRLFTSLHVTGEFITAEGKMFQFWNGIYTPCFPFLSQLLS